MSTKDIIKPEHINVADHFWGAFANYEQGEVARWVVRFLQIRNAHERAKGWEPFPEDALYAFYQKHVEDLRESIKPFNFRGLLSDEYLSVHANMVTVSDSFVRAIAQFKE